MPRRVSVLPSALIGRCDRLLALVVAATVAGCAPVAAPVVMGPVLCPEPAAPALRQVDGNLPLDSVRNLDALLTRDDEMRQYIKGLLRALRCYRAQVPEETS